MQMFDNVARSFIALSTGRHGICLLPTKYWECENDKEAVPALQTLTA